MKKRSAAVAEKDTWKKLGNDVAKIVVLVDRNYGLCKIEHGWDVRKIVLRARALRRAERKKGVRG